MRIAVREEEFELLPDRCLYWPSQELLAVADVHLGKAETFQQQGLWLPADAREKDLSTLSEVIAGRTSRIIAESSKDTIETSPGTATPISLATPSPATASTSLS